MNSSTFWEDYMINTMGNKYSSTVNSLQLKEKLEVAIRETNRCLYVGNIHIPETVNPNYKKTLIEAHALFKNWVCREARKIIGYWETDYMTDPKRVILSFEKNPSQIEKITIKVWERNSVVLSMILVILEHEINYKSLQYSPKLLYNSLQDFWRQTSLQESVERMNFNDILNIKFP